MATKLEQQESVCQHSIVCVLMECDRTREGCVVLRACLGCPDNSLPVCYLAPCCVTVCAVLWITIGARRVLPNYCDVFDKSKTRSHNL